MKILLLSLASFIAISSPSVSFAKSMKIASKDAISLLRGSFQSHSTGSDLLQLSGTTSDGKNCSLSISGMDAKGTYSSVMLLTLLAGGESENKQLMFNLDEKSEAELVNQTSNQIVMKQSESFGGGATMQELDLGSAPNSVPIIYGENDDRSVKETLQLDNENGKISVSLANGKKSAICNLSL